MFYAHLAKIQKMMAENEHNITEESLWERYNITEKSLWERQSVFKVPPHITSLNTNAFKPIVISFGPYHYNEQHLKPMEAHKLRSRERFLKITNTTLEDFLQSFKPMEQQLMDHYEQLGDEWRDGDCFLELMTRDGCFMLDILQSTTGYASKYSANDPVFGRSPQSNVMCQNIKRDMLLIENQLPLLVLERLIADNEVVLEKLKDENIEDWKKLKEGEISEEEFIHKKIHELILKFFESYEVHIQRHNVLCLHALDVFRESMIQRPIQRLVWIGVTPRANFPPATALRNTGVAFKRNETFSFMDITFKKGVLTLPHIFINKQTEPTILNLMAFERFQAGKGQEVSAYIDFMDSLVRSAKDVSLLRSMEIITTSRESDEAIAVLFHELAKNQLVDPDDSLDEVRQSLANHYRKHFWRGRCNERLAEWGSNFKQTYCKNPWTVIGLVAGIILLALTVMQTLYTAIPYYGKEHSSITPPQNSSHR